MSNQESINKLWLLVMPVSLLLVVFGFLIINIIPSKAVLLINSNNYLGTRGVLNDKEWTGWLRFINRFLI